MVKNLNETTTTVTVVKNVTYTKITEVYGFSFDETGSAVVEMELRDGGATGDVQARVNIAADATANMSYARPKSFPSGLHIKLVSGAFRGMVDV